MDPLTYRTVHTNGVDLQVAVANQGGPRGLALLVHGFPEHAFSWRHQIPALAEAGYEVWAPNTRGYGDSDKPEAVSAYAMDELLADLAGLVDAADREHLTLVGHDWGAAQAWMFAIRRVRPVERLVIMNVPHPACMRRELRSFRQLRKSWYIFFFQLPWLPEKLFTSRNAKAIGDAFTNMAVDDSRFPDRVTDVFRENARKPGAIRSMVNYYRAAIRNAKDSQNEDLPVIETPTLMVWGLEDKALGRETTDGTDEHVSDLTLRYLPGVSHWVQQEAPEVVNTILLAWLNGDPVPEASEVAWRRMPDPAYS
ncbi:MAG: alpha/beta fold hydrolase [Actinomycetota bacterium]